MSTPQERRKALFDAMFEGPLPPAASIDTAADLVESWLTEKDADITGLRALIEAYEHKFVAKNAEIERLRHYDDVIRAEIRADERRRTAEEIKRQAHRELQVRFTYLNVVRICDEVGGSDGQQ